MKWKRVKFWLWLEVEFPTEDFDDGSQGSQGVQGSQIRESCEEEQGEIVCFDLISFNSEFELNGIPSASCNVAVGRRANDVLYASRIHALIDQMQLQLPAKVWCLARTVFGSSTPGDTWPESSFPIIIGNVTGSAFKR